jgi:hypothetical protein
VVESPLSSLLERADRRSLWTSALARTPRGATAFLLVLFLILLAGTALLSPWILMPVALLAAAYIGWPAWRHRLDAYRLAQRIDQSMNLQDRLSTAHHFTGSDAPMAVALRKQAESTAPAVDLRRAFPTPPVRSWRGAALLTVAAAGLITYRWLTLESVDLTAPAIHVNAESQQAGQAEATARAQAKRFRERLKQMGVNLEELEGLLGWSSQPSDGKDAGQTATQQMNPSAPNQQPQQQGQKAEGQNSPNQQGQQTATDQQPPQQGQGAPPQNAQSQGPNKGQEGVMDKMREALASLADKLQGKQNAGQQTPKTDQAQQQMPGQQQAQNQPGDLSKMGNQQGQPQQGPPNQGKDGDQAASDSQKNKTGMGSGDGDKAIAEQQLQNQQMNKISELIGRRAENVSGDMQVKTSSKFNRLQTAYTGQEAAEANADAGDLSREQISIESQAYVKRYFLQLHKGRAKSSGASQ